MMVYTMNNIKIEFTNESIIPASGLSIVGIIISKGDFVKNCNRMDVTPNRSQNQIKNGDILLIYIGMLCMGKPQYHAVHEMDDIGDSLQSRILAENMEMLYMDGIVPF